MGWKVVERRIGRAGGVRQRMAKQREWDRKYGEGLWETGYVLEGNFISQEAAFEKIYFPSYRAHFEEHPEDLQELISLAKELRNPHAQATTGVDLQIPAILKVLEEKGLQLQGTEVVDIGTWQGERSHPISVRLSPLQVRCVLRPKWTLEKFWQRQKVLAVWQDDQERLSTA